MRGRHWFSSGIGSSRFRRSFSFSFKASVRSRETVTDGDGWRREGTVGKGSSARPGPTSWPPGPTSEKSDGKGQTTQPVVEFEHGTSLSMARPR